MPQKSHIRQCGLSIYSAPISRFKTPKVSFECETLFRPACAKTSQGSGIANTRTGDLGIDTIVRNCKRHQFLSNYFNSWNINVEPIQFHNAWFADLKAELTNKQTNIQTNKQTIGKTSMLNMSSFTSLTRRFGSKGERDGYCNCNRCPEDNTT